MIFTVTFPAPGEIQYEASKPCLVSLTKAFVKNFQRMDMIRYFLFAKIVCL